MLLSLWQALQKTLFETQSLLRWHGASRDWEQPSHTGLPPPACPGLPPDPRPSSERGRKITPAPCWGSGSLCSHSSGSAHPPRGPTADIFSLLPVGHRESPAPCFLPLSSPSYQQDCHLPYSGLFAPKDAALGWVRTDLGPHGSLGVRPGQWRVGTQAGGGMGTEWRRKLGWDTRSLCPSPARSQDSQSPSFQRFFFFFPYFFNLQLKSILDKCPL